MGIRPFIYFIFVSLLFVDTLISEDVLSREVADINFLEKVFFSEHQNNYFHILQTSTQSTLWERTKLSGDAHLIYKSTGSLQLISDETMMCLTDLGLGSVFISTDQGKIFKKRELKNQYVIAEGEWVGIYQNKAYWLQESGIERFDFSSEEAEVQSILEVDTPFTVSCYQKNIFVVFVEKDTGKIYFKSSNDDGETWSVDHEIIELDISLSWKLGHLTFENSKHGSFCISIQNEIYHYQSIDGGQSWSDTLITNNSKDQFWQRQQAQDVEFIFYHEENGLKIATSLDMGLSWTIREADVDSKLQLISAKVYQNGQYELWYSSGAYFSSLNPFVLVNSIESSMSVHKQYLTLDWQDHPFASSYEIYLNKTRISEIDQGPYSYESAYSEDFSFEIIPKYETYQGRAHSFKLETPAEVELEYNLQKGSSSEGFYFLSFPFGAYAVDEGIQYTAKSYMEKFLGLEYDPANWKLGSWDPARLAYVSGRDLSSLEIARGYWYIASYHLSYTLHCLDITEKVLVRLKPGWNMVGNPFVRRVSWGSSLQVYQGGRIWNYDQLAKSEETPLYPELWAWKQGEYGLATELEVGQGYWLRNRDQRDILLKLQPSSDQFKSNNFYQLKPSGDQPPQPPNFDVAPGISNVGAGGGCFLR